MKTLILNGSPRIMGDTAQLIKNITDNIAGEYRMVDTYRCNISPCIDCRYCWEEQGCARFFRKEEPVMKAKKGAVVLVGGGDGNVHKPYETACTLLHHMNCYDIHKVVYSHNTNERPAIKDEMALSGINSILNFFS